MKFLSIKNLFQGAANTIKQHPFEMLFALIGTIAATVKIELNSVDLVNEK